MKTTLMMLSLAMGALAAQAQNPNTLTKAEQRAGWQLLFDGQTLNGWHRYNGGEPGDAWKVENGTIMLDGAAKKSGAKGGDLVTNDDYEDFDFQYEWKISPNGNSGVMFHVVESKAYPTPYMTGPEMQVLDDNGHPDGKIFKHRSGDLYDLIPSPARYAKPVGQWNKARITVQRGFLTLYLNGHKTASVEMYSLKWADLVANSKFKTMPDFGKFPSGRLDLQDHGDTVWYRNLKVRRLSTQVAKD
jgi:hypothetical protein